VDDRLLTILQTAHQFNLTTGLLYTAVARGELATIRLPPPGHAAGTLSTIHANGLELALRPFAWRVLLSGVDVPYPAIRYGLAECLRCWCIWNGAANRRLMTDLVRAGTTPAPTPMTLSRCESDGGYATAVHGEESMLRIGSFCDTSPRVGYLARDRRVHRRQPSTQS
jgi:hypothetical protein